MPGTPCWPAHSDPGNQQRREGAVAQQRELQTKERILDCAVALFTSRGYDATTMDDIGECADVSRATVFNYFARKEDMITEVYRRRRAELAERIAEAREKTSDTPQVLRRALADMARSYEDEPATSRATARAWLRAGGPLLPDAFDSAAIFADVIRSGQQRGDIHPSLDATYAGRVIFDVYLGAIYRWVSHEDDKFSLADNLMAMLDVVFAGMTRDTPTEPS